MNTDPAQRRPEPAPAATKAWERLRRLFPGQAHAEKAKAFAEFEEVFAGHPETIKLAQAVWLTGRGLTYARRGRLFKALDSYAEAMTLKRDHIPAYLGLAITFRRLGQAGGGYSYIAAAIDVLKKLPRRIRVLEREMNWELFGAAVYAEWATIHILSGSRDKAAECLEKALRFHERAQALGEEEQRLLLSAGCRLDAEYAGNLRATLAAVRA